MNNIMKKCHQIDFFNPQENLLDEILNIPEETSMNEQKTINMLKADFTSKGPQDAIDNFFSNVIVDTILQSYDKELPTENSRDE